MSYSFSKLTYIFKKLFSKKPSAEMQQRELLRQLIEEAKEKVIVERTPYPDIIHIANMDEICSILGFKKTLGMALFVKFYIAGKMDTEKCIERLLPEIINRS